MKETTVGTLLVLGAAAGFGTIGIFGKVAAAIDLGLPRLLPTRFALATVAVVTLARLRGWPIPHSRRAYASTFALGVVYTGMTLFFFVALRYLTAGLATIVLYTYPVLVVGLAVAFLRESLTWETVLALGGVLLGVTLIVDADTASVEPIGVWLALGAAGCYALYTIGSRTLVADIEPRALLLGVLIGTTVSMTAYGVISGRFGLPSGVEEWGIVIGLTAMGTVGPLLLFYEGVARLEASRVGVVSTVEPLVTVSLGVVLLGEPMTTSIVLGGLLVLGGVVLVQRHRPSDQGPGAIART